MRRERVNKIDFTGKQRESDRQQQQNKEPKREKADRKNVCGREAGGKQENVWKKNYRWKMWNFHCCIKIQCRSIQLQRFICVEAIACSVLEEAFVSGNVYKILWWYCRQCQTLIHCQLLLPNRNRSGFWCFWSFMSSSPPLLSLSSLVLYLYVLFKNIF